jgi:hypothetical protein
VGVFVGPHIRELFRDRQFDEILHDDKETAWESIKYVCSQFLGKGRLPNYKELVGELPSRYEKNWLYPVSENPLSSHVTPGELWSGQ